MAFTDAQKRDIRKYLGVPMGFYDKNTRLESMMDLVGANSTDQDEIDAWLVRLAEIDVELVTASAATSVTYGALKQVDEIEFHKPDGDGSTGSISIVEQGRALIDRIARAFGVGDALPAGDYFGGKRPMTFSVNLG